MRLSIRHIYRPGFLCGQSQGLFGSSFLTNFHTSSASRRRKLNIERQDRLQKERQMNLGDFVMGNPTEWTNQLIRSKQFFQNQLQKKTTPLVPLKFPISMTEVDNILQKFDELNVSTLNEAREFLKVDDFAAPGSTDNVFESLRDLDEAPGAAEYFQRLAQELSNMSQINDSRKESIRRIFSLSNSNAKLAEANNKRTAIESFARTDNDTGSPEVQAAAFTTKILALKDHSSRNQKDQTAKRKLRFYAHQRQRILKYLRLKNFERYLTCIDNLGLTDDAVLREIVM
ncbi:ribosomal protein subunit S28 [Schizosaccharomyces cryophilus OY26]|uniref:Ribosomal protein subunit S28 n=1 Tax=Schizosaccharomyces cryophilus (strain OY26 / ATCC MYA-4695 / CBS 11777 / NBRC 106824 / NRRL Y48691) TaxID=653667 RepID=S9VSU9_SCHCR|nr:ribosomal protein subunit S28 [Schizosaccharomyces cryophilus OY26]EPY49215.1 ribosomal protein subunit S28 [Schizosaccharomyces cryophilus OY26]